MTPAFDYRVRIVLFALGLILGNEVMSRGRLEVVTPAGPGETLDAAVRRNVAAVLAERQGATVLDPQRDVRWLNMPSGALGVLDALRPVTFIALAAPPGAGQARDLYRLEGRVTPYGVVFDTGWVVNLTRTATSDDTALAVSGTRVATASLDDGKLSGVTVIDFAGEDPDRVGIGGWSRLRRWGNQLENIERTGDSRGVDEDHYPVRGESAPSAVALRFDGAALQVLSPSGVTLLARLDLATHEAHGALAFGHLGPRAKTRYPFLNWLADRGRGLADRGLAPEWAGSGIELLKELYLRAGEVKADIQEVVEADVPVEVEEDEVDEEAVERARFQAEESQQPWPPLPLEPMLDERMKGEGLWEAVGPEVVQHQPNAPPPFYRTFLRAESDYRLKRVWVVAWDPEQVSLHMRAGTHNPEPQTGHRGDGTIPREPEHLGAVVGGFNGGFQTAHIWYGMMVDRKVLLRPREYGATVGSWADGRTAFGTWRPRAKIPEDLVAFRQNLPPLIEDGVFNPYKRRTWGWHRHVAGAVSGRTIRSAVCYTTDGYVMYFYSEFSDENGLTSALLNCSCRYAVHLDMNKGHTGFEFYRLLATGEEPSVADADKEVAGIRFQGTSMHPEAAHMKSPTRYLGTDYRDYFYLRLRSVVPGPDLEPLADGGRVGGEGTWQVGGLAHNAEFPPRAAYTRLRGSRGGELSVVQMDPRGATVFVAEAELPPEVEDPPALEPAPGGGGVTPEAAPLPGGVTPEAAPLPGGPEPVATPEAGQPVFDPDTLMMTVPLGFALTGASALVRIGDVTLQGSAFTTAPSEEAVPAATVIGVDGQGLVWIVVVHNASLADAKRALEARGATSQMAWLAPMSRDPSPPVHLYQSTNNAAGEPAWIELELGEQEGTVVPSPSRDTRRLVIAARPRLPRIERLFPDMRPRNRQKR